MRLFLAIRISDEIIDNAVKIQHELDLPDVQVKWVEPYNMHVTLKFFGETDNKTRMMIENIMEAVFKKTKPFYVQFKGFGVFPNLQSPRVIWAGIGEGEDILKKISEKLNDTIALLNVRSEQWSFSGHLTIGRIKSGHQSNALLECLRNLSEEALGNMKVEAIELMESKLSPKGPEYRILKKVQLAE